MCGYFYIYTDFIPTGIHGIFSLFGSTLENKQFKFYCYLTKSHQHEKMEQNKVYISEHAQQQIIAAG